MTWKRIAAVSAAVLISVALAACTGSPQPTDSAEAKPFVVAGAFSTDSLDPHGTAAGAIGTSHADESIFSRLVRADSSGKIVADAATSWKSNANGTSWTFTLRKGIEFSDGQPLTSADVVASFNRLLALKGPLAGNFPGVTATANGTEKVTFSSPTMLLLGRIALLYITKADVTDASFSKPIGSGPYVVDSFSPAATLKLSPNPKYYGRQPRVSSLEYRWIPDTTARLTALQTGEVDATWGIPDDQVPALKSDSSLVVKTVPSTSVATMWFNSSRPALASATVRNAIWQAVDFKTIVKALYPQSGSISKGIVAPDVFGYSELTAKKYDPKAAKAALEKAHFDFSQSLVLQYSDAQYTQFIGAVASDLAKVGVKAVPTQKDSAVFLKDLLALNWDINFQALGTAAFDAATNTGRLYSCSANRMGYCNPELDTILAQAGNTTDKPTRASLYAKANKIIWDDAVGMYPMLLNVTYAWRSDVTGFTPDPLLQPDLSHVGFSG